MITKTTITDENGAREVDNSPVEEFMELLTRDCETNGSPLPQHLLNSYERARAMGKHQLQDLVSQLTSLARHYAWHCNWACSEEGHATIGKSLEWKRAADALTDDAVRRGLEDVAEDKTVSRGSFAQYAEEE